MGRDPARGRATRRERTPAVRKRLPMKKTLNLVALVFAFFMLSGVAKADQLIFTTTMTGAQEVPPTGSPGVGSALVTIDTVTNLMTVNVAFAGLQIGRASCRER